MRGLVRRTSMRRVAALAVTVACAAVLLAATTAAASLTRVKTTVAITSTGATKFTGKVTSPKRACEKGRKVTLYRQMGARPLGANVSGYPGYEPQGNDMTDADGNWEIVASEFFVEGTFRAAVAPKKITAGGHSWLCSPVWGRFTPA
jgi:hypothetical protein